MARSATFNAPTSPGKNVRSFQGAPLALGHNSLCEAPSLRLFAVVAKYFFQLRGIEGIDDLPGIDRLPPVHAHIEGRLGAEAETSFRIVDLMRRNTKIQNHASTGCQRISSRISRAAAKLACRVRNRRPDSLTAVPLRRALPRLDQGLDFAIGTAAS